MEVVRLPQRKQLYKETGYFYHIDPSKLVLTLSTLKELLDEYPNGFGLGTAP